MSNVSQIQVLPIDSEYLEEPTDLEVLAPDELEEGRRYPVVYVLPVNPGREGRWGSGMQEALNLDAANRYGVFCVGPTFARFPWYADHPSAPRIREESYMLKDVAPLVDASFPTQACPEGRLLLGFSKSGWGAFSLLLRNPEVFGRAVAWDAPLDMRELPDGWGLEEHFGDATHFGAYRIADLLEQKAAVLRDDPERLILMTSPSLGFHRQMEAAHSKMEALHIPHSLVTTNAGSHNWSSGWFPEAFERLVRGAASAVKESS